MAKYDKYRSLNKPNKKRIPPQKIIAWIEKNFEYKTRKGGQEYQICDPFDYDQKFRFGISPELGVCHSWHGDEWAGPVNPRTGKRNCSFINFVRIFKKLSYKDALRDVLGASESISDYMRPENRVMAPDAERKLTVALPDGASLLADAKDKQAIIVKNWLIKRGYTLDTIAKHELYHLGMQVFWPYFEFEEMVYWQSRSRVNKFFRFPDAEIYNDKGEIIGKTEGTKGDFLYGFDDVEPANYLILTEAIFDKNTLGDQALAISGAVLTNTQIKKIKLLGPRNGVILAPDNDIAGYKSVLTNHALLDRAGFKVFVSFPPEIPYVKDPSKTAKDFNELFTECKLPLKDIRQHFENNIKRLTTNELIKLRRLVYEMDKSGRNKH